MLPNKYRFLSCRVVIAIFIRNFLSFDWLVNKRHTAILHFFIKNQLPFFFDVSWLLPLFLIIDNNVFLITLESYVYG